MISYSIEQRGPLESMEAVGLKHRDTEKCERSAEWGFSQARSQAVVGRPSVWWPLRRRRKVARGPGGSSRFGGWREGAGVRWGGEGSARRRARRTMTQIDLQVDYCNQPTSCSLQSSLPPRRKVGKSPPSIALRPPPQPPLAATPPPSFPVQASSTAGGHTYFHCRLDPLIDNWTAVIISVE